MSINPEVMRAAQDAVLAIDGPASIGSLEVVRAALTAAAPLIEARAKAEALREFAEEITDSVRTNGRLVPNCNYFADLARARAAIIEGETK